MFWSIFLILFLVFVLYFLFIPIVFFIDTAENQYYIQLKSLAKASIESNNEEIFRIKLKILFFNFYFYPLRKKSATKKKILGKKQIVKKRKRMDIRKIARMLRSFKIKSFLLDIDSGNCIYNARLFPLFGFLNFYCGDFRINFEGRNRLVLGMENRPINILKSLIKT